MKLSVGLLSLSYTNAYRNAGECDYAYRRYANNELNTCMDCKAIAPCLKKALKHSDYFSDNNDGISPWNDVLDHCNFKGVQCHYSRERSEYFCNNECKILPPVCPRRITKCEDCIGVNYQCYYENDATCESYGYHRKTDKCPVRDRCGPDWTNYMGPPTTCDDCKLLHKCKNPKSVYLQYKDFKSLCKDTLGWWQPEKDKPEGNCCMDYKPSTCQDCLEITDRCLKGPSFWNYSPTMSHFALCKTLGWTRKNGCK